MQMHFLLFCCLADINFHAYTALTKLKRAKINLSSGATLCQEQEGCFSR